MIENCRLISVNIGYFRLKHRFHNLPVIGIHLSPKKFLTFFCGYVIHRSKKFILNTLRKYIEYNNMAL